ncbi:MAG: hypothetical protein AAGG72_03455 [Pseudomonadota bacterium]
MWKTTSKLAVIACAASALAITSAFATSVTNKDAKDQNIIVDRGTSEETVTIPAGKTVDVSSSCGNQCGLTGPRGFTVTGETGKTYTLQDGDFFPTNDTSS